MPRIETRLEGLGKLIALAAETSVGSTLLVANCSAERFIVRTTGRDFQTYRLIDAQARLATSVDKIAYRPFAKDELDLDAYAVAMFR